MELEVWHTEAPPRRLRGATRRPSFVLYQGVPSSDGTVQLVAVTPRDRRPPAKSAGPCVSKPL